MATSDDPRKMAKVIDDLIERVEALEEGGGGSGDGGVPKANIDALEARIVAAENAVGDVPRGRAGKLSARIDALEAQLGGATPEAEQPEPAAEG
jgi:hypothetical protein